MKKFMLMSVTVFLACGITSTSKASYFNTNNANGDVISARQCNTVAPDGSCSEYSGYGYDNTYDSGGNILTQRYCNSVDADGSCLTYSNGGYDYTYDSKGNMTSKKECRIVAADGSCSNYYAGNYYFYDSDGNKIKDEFYGCDDKGNCPKWNEYHYTYEDGNMIKEEYYHNCYPSDCQKAYENNYTYVDGNKTKNEYYDCSSPSGCVKHSETNYTYEDGNMTKEETYNQCYSSSGCKLSSETLYTYENGNLMKEEFYSNCSSPSHCFKSSETKYEFDEWGNIINKYVNGSLSESYKYSDGYYLKLEQQCSDAGNCSVCTEWSTLISGKCVQEYGWQDDGTLIIPDNFPEIKEDIFGLSSGIPEKIICRGDVLKCKNLLRNYPIYSGYSSYFSDGYPYGSGGYPYGVGSGGFSPYGYNGPLINDILSVDLSDHIEPADESICESPRYYWSGSSCNNKSGGINCEENFKQMETWCNRIRYTPADAAKVLKDTDNEIIMTFKVNR